jgi:hypothetical protein
MRDVDETNEGADASPPDTPEPLSLPGQRAMQGDAQAAPADHSRYVDAAREGAAEHPDHYIKAQGRAGERPALQQIADQHGQAADLNRKDAKFPADDVGRPEDEQPKQESVNFPIYDVGGPEGVASVKVRGLEQGDKLDEATLRQYSSDFEEAIGRGGGAVAPALGGKEGDWGTAKFNNAAEHLYTLAYDKKAALPSEIAESPASAADYLREKATLDIPADHVPQVQDYLRDRLLSDDDVTRQVQASRLGLDVNSPNYENDVNGMLARIRPLPVNSGDIRAIMDERRR